ncbi:hypothetical protein GLAREA_11027 [Glarea lozoyensis ATCC 20868]|uniref:Complex I intermediate-associated protein 84, mitochondrial n=1 Tax=Glarea lozoyensis (strain ATCC 20868 / MF5171) TaxID=1116229 RepID=S3EAJ5_GLAL2|nr:uncharacterized protein GLAREA_11027 [Glarea lozoyensis ATCC 20868]EPE35328.1 hypothetical protein GLAREA_11027 [Glarea lozoyensis ATCC 20868]
MRSHLTRSVFRRLLSSEGFTFPCPSQSAITARRSPSRNASPIFLHPQRRSIFGFSRKPPRQPKEASVDPGWLEMLKFLEMQHIGARLPPSPGVAMALKKFVVDKESNNRAVNSLQAGHVLRVLEHLKGETDEVGSFLLSNDDLMSCMAIMKTVPEEDPEKHIAVAQAVRGELSRRGFVEDFGQLSLMIQILAAGGQPTSARDLLHGHPLAQPSSTAQKAKRSSRLLFSFILKSFADQNNETEIRKTLDLMERGGHSYTPQLQNAVVEFYVRRGDVESTKFWIRKPLAGGTIRADTLALVLKLNVAKGEVDWCKDVFREVLDSEYIDKDHWDVVLLWAAGALGKGVEDVERMMKVMVRRNRRNEEVRPDINTINGLVELAISLNDPYLAERYINLGAKWNIQPNVRTFILQMKYRVDAGDMAGAQAVYDSLQAEEVLDEGDLPVINRYLRALCSRPNTFDRITTILADLDARKARLEPDTTAEIAMIYLERESIQDMYDILQTNVYHYSLEERARIRDRFVNFCIDQIHSDAQAWDAYQVVKSIFDETETAIRTQLMQAFFARKRPDMASYVFGHMRQHHLTTRKPTLETYIACFEGIASCKDAESLDMVHNMFKLDSAMEPNTKLYNALMLAYTAIDDGDRALEFWVDITNSTEGPSYQSLEIVFRACEVAPFGYTTVKETWAKMRRMEIEITRDVWQAYIGALGGRGKLEEAKDAILNGEKEYGLKPDFMTFGIFYNAMPGQNRKDEIEEWGRGMYPEVWAELEKVGRMYVDEGFVTLFKIERTWKA